MSSMLPKPFAGDYMIQIHPPQTKSVESYQPEMLLVPSELICSAAPRFNDFMADVDVPCEVTPYGVLQIIAMQEVVSDAQGNDCTWLALKLFIAWLLNGDGVVVTEIEDEGLDLDVLLQFGMAVRCEDYQKCIDAAKKQARAEIEADGRLKLRHNSTGSLKQLETAVGEFELVRIMDEEAEHEFHQSVNVRTPESESDSEWTTALP